MSSLHKSASCLVVTLFARRFFYFVLSKYCTRSRSWCHKKSSFVLSQSSSGICAKICIMAPRRLVYLASTVQTTILRTPKLLLWMGNPYKDVLGFRARCHITCKLGHAASCVLLRLLAVRILLRSRVQEKKSTLGFCFRLPNMHDSHLAESALKLDTVSTPCQVFSIYSPPPWYWILPRIIYPTWFLWWLPRVRHIQLTLVWKLFL
jgi:hypothetical protein